MGIFKRLFRWGQSEVNEAMESLEDPIKMADQGVRELEQNLEKTIKALATVKAGMITAKNQLDTARQEATDYQNKAMMFLKAAEAGKITNQEAEQRATQCLEKKSQIAQNIPTLEKNYNTYQAQVNKFENTVKELRYQLDKWKNESKMLKARAKVSEATASVNKELAGIDSSGTIAMLEKMKEKVEQQEAMSDTYMEIAAQSSTDRDIDNALKQIGGSIEVQNDLAALKAQLQEAKAIESKVDTQKAINSGIASELEDLKREMAEKQTIETSNSADRPIQQADQSPLES